MKLHVFKDPEAVSMAAAEWIIDYVQQVSQKQPRFTWLLSGGNTPKQLYHLLATDRFSNKVDWKKIHIFFGDERVVPFEDERNNGKMTAESLLNHVNVPAEQIHFIDTVQDPTLSATAYENLLHDYFTETTSFDLALLGMGEDGHTLSLFPHSSLIYGQHNWVNAVYVAAQQMHRVTLMPGIVNSSARIAFLVTGKSKAPALKQVLQGKYQPEEYPAQLIQPFNRELHWFLDEAAASAL